MESMRNLMWTRKKKTVETEEFPVKDPSKYLWEKDKDSDQYIDLFSIALEDEVKNEVEEEFEELTQNPDRKENAKSKNYRDIGHTIVDPFVALNTYNKSLRYAEIGSRHVSLAYANRASCFYELTEYKKAFVSINMAKEDVHFPTFLLAKLAELEENIKARFREKHEKEIEEVGDPTEVRRELAYAANKKHPCLSDVVKIKESKQYGRYIVSKYKLPADQIILIEEAYLHAFDTESLRSCGTCLTEDVNFIACEGCTETMFCNKECQARNELHKWECNTFLTSVIHQIRIAIYSILLAIDAFTTNGETDVNELIQGVEKLYKEKEKKQYPESTLDSKSKYQFFFKLAISGLDPERAELVIRIIYMIFLMVLKIPKNQSLFVDEKSRRFLQHLITHHICVINTNSFGEENSTTLGLVESLFNHSCAPSINRELISNEQYYYTGKKVQEGVQLFITYLNLEAYKDKSVRQKKLRENWCFDCNCIVCAPKEPSLADKCNSALMTILYNQFEREFENVSHVDTVVDTFEDSAVDRSENEAIEMLEVTADDNSRMKFSLEE
ncbi:uncharacterized protein LOC116341024 [Contarinia nasturtii]|uniref:uncharacterized protein LOC116341024 n=1 Tax=Contarinia nasturtii TaxID=265458 RepID=UPI0012D4B836|nr:uncharacterized protein LOC116341024 [Contarinia nasturtii]